MILTKNFGHFYSSSVTQPAQKQSELLYYICTNSFGSTLSLVDLAGSESVRHTGATGERQKEGGMNMAFFKELNFKSLPTAF
jgi:hypothetical protein